MPQRAWSLVRGFFGFLYGLVQTRHLIFDLTRREFRARYLGSYLGLFWAFIHPTITITLYWFVLQYGLRASPVSDVPYVLWLMTGLVPWFFISECIGGGTSVILENRFLVKKVVFRVSTLPVVRLLSSMPIHLFFTVATIGMVLFYQRPVTLHAIQLFYYLAASLVLLLGLTWLTCSIVPFFKDMIQVIMVMLQFLFWLTPIFWTLAVLPDRYRWILELNPIYYIVRGYRESMIDHVWFWEHPGSTAYFWTVALLLLAVGALVFRRLKPHFADVL